MLRCEICNIDAFVKPLYRNNKKGVPGVWRCKDHLGKKPKTGVKEIVDIIHRRNLK